MGGPPIASALIALILVEFSLVLFSVAIKKSLIGSEWGANHSSPFWSWRRFAYFFAQDCFFVWCESSHVRRRDCSRKYHPAMDGMSYWLGANGPGQCGASDWNAVSFGNDCVIDGFLQFHAFEGMMLKVKRTHVHDGCTVAFGATVMGGAVIERDTTLLPLSLVPRRCT